MSEQNLTDTPTKVSRTPWRAMLLVVIVTALAIWLVPSERKAPVDLPPPPPAAALDRTPATEQGSATASREAPATAPAGSTARQLIATQRRAGKPDTQAAYVQARKLAQAGQAEDAYLLDFYAARLGHADAAFALAEQADPAFWQPGGTLKAAAPDQARKWYRAARDAGHPQAAERLAALRAWAEAAASHGDADAQRLMLTWQ